MLNIRVLQICMHKGSRGGLGCDKAVYIAMRDEDRWWMWRQYDGSKNTVSMRTQQRDLLGLRLGRRMLEERRRHG
jgi:hypothetical protein